MDWFEKIDTILKERGISRRELARMAGINEQTLGTVFRNRPKHLPFKYGQPIAKALCIDPRDLYGEALPGVVIGPADQELHLPTYEDLSSDNYKIQQITLAYRSYKDPQHRVNLLEKALQCTSDDFRCRLICAIYSSVMNPEQCDELYRMSVQFLQDEF